MSNQPPLYTTPIIDRCYCTERQPIDLIITKERSVRDKFIIKDMNNNVIFTVKSSLQTIITPRQHRFLFDANGNLILHLRGSLQDGSWKAFRGGSSEANDLIFIRKRSSFIPLNTKLNVFLANNTTGISDFTIKKTFLGESWDVSIGQSDNVVAQINKKLRIMFEREKFMVTVLPNIDYAFIVALVMTLD